jgi:hypothetical protein
MRTIIVLRFDGMSGEIIPAFTDSDIQVIGARVNWPGTAFSFQLSRMDGEPILRAGNSGALDMGGRDFDPIRVDDGVRWQVKETWAGVIVSTPRTPRVEIVVSVAGPDGPIGT